VAEITTPELDAFYRALLTTRKPATVRQTHAILRRAFRQAVRWGWVATNPAVEATPPRVRRAQLQIPGPDQMVALIAAAEVEDPELACFLRLAVATGARRGELCGLRWSRVDLAGGAVLIDQAVVEVGGVIIEKDPKPTRPGGCRSTPARWRPSSASASARRRWPWPPVLAVRRIRSCSPG
jgi:integrase